jgi:TolB-like protein/class 3 adenylate cyclase
VREQGVQRRLAAILAADVVGYSRMIELDEVGTLARLRRVRHEIVDPVLAEHGGRIFKLMGDGMLAEFPSAVQALRAAIDLQEQLRARNEQSSDGERIEVRIGVHQGDVVVEGRDLLGDGVNIAARLESLAEPGGICISARVYEDATGKVAIDAQDMGEQALKNIGRAVHAFRVSVGSPATGQKANEGRPALPLPDKPSIAVLPFQNMSGDPEQEYFADGIVEDIVTALSRFRQLFVIARNSSFVYKGRAVDVKQVGRELGVRYVLEGSVRKAADRVRIAGQLIDASRGTHLWADRFEGALDAIFDLQDQVTASVVGAIASKLEQAEIVRAKTKPTQSLDAYDYYLRGIAGIHNETRASTSEALHSFYRAIELDPEFASAHGMAALCYDIRKWNGWIGDRTHEIAETARLARRGAELGKDDAVALCTGGFALAHVVGELDEGNACLDRALTLNPNLAMGWHFSGWVKAYLGESDIAIEHVSRAMRLSPLDPFSFLAQGAVSFAHFTAGRYEDAVVWAQKSVREQPNFAPMMRLFAASCAMAGKLEEAQKALRRARELDPVFRIAHIVETTPLRRMEDFARYEEGLRLAGLPQ